MTTQEKLERYEFALRDWQLKMKAFDPQSLLGSKPIEPIADQYGFSSGLEIWAAAKVRSAVMAETASQPARAAE